MKIEEALDKMINEFVTGENSLNKGSELYFIANNSFNADRNRMLSYMSPGKETEFYLAHYKVWFKMNEDGTIEHVRTEKDEA